MRAAIFLALGLALGLTACQKQASVTPHDAPPKVSVTKHGAPLSGAPAVALAAVVKDPDQYAGKNVTVDGRVRAACTSKGCWMEIAEAADKSKPGFRVTFKDYGFFVPLDSAGTEARVDGQVEVRTIDKTQVEHLESEGATFAMKSPDGSARELRMVATGVELRRKL